MDSIINLIINGEDNGATSVLGNVSGAVDGLGGVLQNAAGFALGGLLTQGINAVTDSMGNLFEGMVGGNAAFEQYQVQFAVLLGSTEAAQTRMAELAAFGAQTPFELPGVVEADRILQGFGLHSAEAAESFGFSGEQIRTIAGDVASGTGSSFQEMATLLGKFSSGATGEAISRMQELGITTRSELADMGLEFSNSGQLLSPLPDAMNTVLGVMQGKYGGMMEAQSTTFTGMMSNLEDWKAGTLRSLGEPIFEVLKDKLGVVLGFLNSPEVMAAVSSFGQTLAAGVGVAVDWFNTVGLPAVQAFVGWLTTEGVAQFQAFVAPITTTIVPALQTFGNWFTGILPTLTGAVTSFVSWKDVLIAVGVVVASVVIPALVSIAAAAAPVLLAGAALVGGIALVRTAWEQDWGGIQGKVEAVVAYIGPLVNNAITGIQTWWAQNGEAILAKAQSVWTSIQTAVSTAITTVQTTITTIVTAIQTFWAAHGNTILTTAQTIWTGITTAVSTAITTAQTTINTIATAIQTFWATHGTTILTTAQTAWTGIQTAVETVTGIISAVIAAFSSALEGDWFAFGENMRTAWDTAWVAIGNVVTAAKDGIVTIVGNLITSVITAFTSTDWGSVGQGIIDGIAGAISGGGGAIASAATSAAQAALDAAKGFLGIQSPSRVAAEEIGRPFNEGIAQGIGASIEPVERAIGGVLGVVQAGAERVRGGFIGIDDPLRGGGGVGGIFEQNPALAGGGIGNGVKDENLIGMLQAIGMMPGPDAGFGKRGLAGGPTQGTLPITTTAPAFPVLPQQTTTRIENHYTVTINDERAMILFLDYLQNITDTTALEAVS